MWQEVPWAPWFCLCLDIPPPRVLADSASGKPPGSLPPWGRGSRAMSCLRGVYRVSLTEHACSLPSLLPPRLPNTYDITSLLQPQLLPPLSLSLISTVTMKRKTKSEESDRVSISQGAACCCSRKGEDYLLLQSPWQPATDHPVPKFMCAFIYACTCSFIHSHICMPVLCYIV